MAKSFAERMIGAAMLDVATYEEVEADVSATSQAAGVVAIVAVASAIGALHGGTGAIIGGIVSAFLGWLLWAGLTYLVGTKAFNGTATWGELLRTLGFAQAPGVLAVLGIVPVLGGVIRFVVMIWLLVTGVIAIRQALDFDTGKAILTALIAWVVIIVVGIVVGLFGAAVMGMGALVH
ncbi:MAG: Yip1 protein [Gemmatimonadetes bacterium]|nr:Yip1 protein [Gemmatimonadota bacterium]